MSRSPYDTAHGTTRPRRAPDAARRGSVLVEQIVILALLAILATITVRAGARLLDGVRVHAASRAVGDLLALAREEASASGVRTAVRFDAAQGRVVVHAGSDTVARHELGLHGDVRLESSRDSIAYAPSGLGYGAANTRVVVRKGVSAETLTVSRLGRVRR